MSQNIILPIPRTQINATSFNSTYLPINAGGLPEACSIIRLVNDTNRDVLISFNGVTGHEYLGAEESFILNFQANAGSSNDVAKLAKGTIIYVLAAAGTGLMFLSGYYQP